ncbi:Peptidase C1A, papain C-terminal [Cinara cedri]|uniref:Peptidase C1A, papain C-terminal n=1 Tax=Cinara cedri TaxID=506608 RepID=A0A5E4N293_9HEMI|nr:Peptidase C1A, papain C-terminal [Cinara cedri]
MYFKKEQSQNRANLRNVRAKGDDTYAKRYISDFVRTNLLVTNLIWAKPYPPSTCKPAYAHPRPSPSPYSDRLNHQQASFIFFKIIFLTIERLNPLANSTNIDNQKQAQESIVSTPVLGEETKLSIIRKRKDSLWKYSTQIPSEFDARKQWAICTKIGESIFDSRWKNSWAFATSTAFADRICIATQGQFNQHLSIRELLFCCEGCGTLDRHGRILESSTAKAWKYYRDTGGVSETDFINNSKCPSGDTIIDTKFRWKSDLYCNNNNRNGTEKYELLAVKIIGWGVENTGDRYWLCLNSYGNSWGDKGTFKIAMGRNVNNIEGKVIAGEPSAFVKKPFVGKFFRRIFPCIH